MNVHDIKDCYGCGLCATVCSKGIIEIVHNKEGFYQPSITNLLSCTNCGLCYDVCSYCQDTVALENKKAIAYAGWSKNPVVRHKASSGGVGFEIARSLMEDGYKVCAVRYNADMVRAEHYIAQTIEELIPSMGSKYIQSYTVNAFKSINRKEKYLVVGTPCQIDSFRRYIRKFRVEENFILMDFFCHGVPSYKVWERYNREVEKKIGRVTSAAFRHKEYGWHDSWAMSMDGEGKIGTSRVVDFYGVQVIESIGSHFSRWTKHDSFYELFLGNKCLGKACYKHCKYKHLNSSADIRLGDCWGSKFSDNKEGVSSVLAFTEKGRIILTSINALQLIHLDESIVTESQMKDKICYPTFSRPLIIAMLRCGFSTRICALVSRIIEKIKHIIK